VTDQRIFSGVHEVVINAPGHATDGTGFVVKWRRRGDLWEALVTHEVDGRVTTEWLPALVLTPQDSP
jgi:hypothetical protein